jgi:hypothetical protein
LTNVTGVPRVAPQIELNDEVRAALERRAASLTLPYRVVVRAKIMLLAAEGRSNTEIAVRVDMSADRVGDWRRRFSEEGLDGLEDRARSGRPRRFPPGRGRPRQGGGLRSPSRARRPRLALLAG